MLAHSFPFLYLCVCLPPPSTLHATYGFIAALGQSSGLSSTRSQLVGGRCRSGLWWSGLLFLLPSSVRHKLFVRFSGILPFLDPAAGFSVAAWVWTWFLCVQGTNHGTLQPRSLMMWPHSCLLGKATYFFFLSPGPMQEFLLTVYWESAYVAYGQVGWLGEGYLWSTG